MASRGYGSACPRARTANDNAAMNAPSASPAPGAVGEARPRVLIIGCGFGGIEAVRALSKAAVEIILVDRTNHHLFQPLLYQVATAGLSAPAISAPIRHALRKEMARGNLTILKAEVRAIDPDVPDFSSRFMQPAQVDALIRECYLDTHTRYADSRPAFAI